MMPSKCVLCNLEEYRNSRDSFQLSDRDTYIVRCAICGNYEITAEAIGIIITESVPLFLLRGYIRYYCIRHKIGLNITSENLGAIINSPTNPRRITSKLDILLTNLEQLTKHGGDEIDIDNYSDYPLAYAENSSELDYLITQLAQIGYIFKAHEFQTGDCIIITTAGWKKLDELAHSITESKTCFVAMSFDSSLDELYELGIEKSVRDSGYDPIRIDREEHSELIPYRMLAEIRKCKFIVADFTQHKHGVYFEAGFGLGLGRPVIWICNKNDFNEAHFDIKQFNHILYENSADLYEKLKTRIEATIY